MRHCNGFYAARDDRYEQADKQRGPQGVRCAGDDSEHGSGQRGGDEHLSMQPRIGFEFPPREHHIGTSPLKRAVLEPQSGGRWYAVFEDGSECDTGKVLAWDPPRRLVLGWQITAQWKFDPSFLTEVEVTFTPEGPKRTLVQLEHRNLERYGAEALGLRKSIDSPGGWGKILGTFAVAAADEGAP